MRAREESILTPQSNTTSMAKMSLSHLKLLPDTPPLYIRVYI